MINSEYVDINVGQCKEQKSFMLLIYFTGGWRAYITCYRQSYKSNALAYLIPKGLCVKFQIKRKIFGSDSIRVHNKLQNYV